MAKRKPTTAKVDWKDYSGDKAVMPICPRSPAVSNFESGALIPSRKLTASLVAVSERIDTVHLVMCDKLDRYNMDSNTTAAIQQGDIWLKKNLGNVQSHFNNVIVTRWDDIMQQPGFDERLGLMQRLYNTNDYVKAVVHKVASYYLNSAEERSKKEGIPFDPKASLQNSVSYLIEQYAGTAQYTSDFGQLPKIYWGVYLEDHKVFQDPLLEQARTLPIHINRLEPPTSVHVTP